MQDNSYYVYMMASKFRGVLYTGMCRNLSNRILQHKIGYHSGFTNKYKVYKLVWYEETNDVNEAILKEKQIKKWKRNYKIRLIEDNNPKWKDLSKNWFTQKEIDKYRQNSENNL